MKPLMFKIAASTVLGNRCTFEGGALPAGWLAAQAGQFGYRHRLLP